jgi:outer membrane protein assembly factor BamA
VGQPYRPSDVRKTQERIATLGVFSSVTVSLSDPYVPQGSKTVIVEVLERPTQYVEVRPGFSTGEGVRGALEYAHRNLLGYAWGLTLHVQVSYLPDFLILDPGVAANYKTLTAANRIATRDTVTMAWPEMGLGPTIRAQLDGVYVRDLERDFTLLKASALGSLIWRPIRNVQIGGGPDYEHNAVHLFVTKQTIEGYLAASPNNSDLARLLRVPDGDSNVVAARVVFTWDRRDSAFNAHSGTYVAAGIEQVNSYPVQGTTAFTQNQFEGHFLRLTQTLAGYVPITSRISFAAEVRLGEIVNVSPCVAPFDPTAPPPYCTYPDRMFFMGGFDSMRGWLQDTFIPQEYADQIASGVVHCSNQSDCQVPLRGGNLMINPRFELRFPVRAPLDAAIFSDFGNLWNDPNYIFARRIAMRADVGAGIRVETPVGPLVFDYGINVTRRSYEDFGAFHFAIGLF